MWLITLDRARQWPGGPARLVVTMPFLGVWVERPTQVRIGLHGTTSFLPMKTPGLVNELFQAIDLNPAAGTALYEYRGLRRSCPLMSETEKQLSPRRFPV